MVFNSFLKSIVSFFFGKNTSEEKLCRGIGSSSVKCFLCIPTKQKLAALFFLQTLVALDTDEHRFLLRNTYGNKSWLSNTKKRRFVQTLKFWSLKKLLQSKDSRCCFCDNFKKNLEAERSLPQICWCWESFRQQLTRDL